MGFTFAYLILLLPVLVISMAVIMLLSLGRLRVFGTRWVGYILGKTSLAVAGVKVREVYHEGKKPEGPAIFLINHSSTLDMFAILAMDLPRARHIAKKEIQYNPFFWMLAKLTGQIMIDRKDPRGAMEQLDQVYRDIRRNRNSIMFAPEGTRSRTGKIGPFKMGAFHAAIELGYPIVPIYIEGAYELCPGGSLITLPGTITGHFHPAIDTSSWDRKTARKKMPEIRTMYQKWAGELEEPETDSSDGDEALRTEMGR